MLAIWKKLHYQASTIKLVNYRDMMDIALITVLDMIGWVIRHVVTNGAPTLVFVGRAIQGEHVKQPWLPKTETL